MSNLYEACHAAGGMTAYEWERDPKRLAFILSRYKFVAKMFANYQRVIEIGCADGFGTRLVRQAANSMYAIDNDRKSIEQARDNNAGSRWDVDFDCVDFLDMPCAGDGIYALDVIEHIDPVASGNFLYKMSRSAPVAIIGTPSLESQAHASELSKKGHINCYTGERLRSECALQWQNVFMFSMNDEVLHTGFFPMSQYLFALCIR